MEHLNELELLELNSLKAFKALRDAQGEGLSKAMLNRLTELLMKQEG